MKIDEMEAYVKRLEDCKTLAALYRFMPKTYSVVFERKIEEVRDRIINDFKTSPLIRRFQLLANDEVLLYNCPDMAVDLYNFFQRQGINLSIYINNMRNEYPHATEDELNCIIMADIMSNPNIVEWAKFNSSHYGEMMVYARRK